MFFTASLLFVRLISSKVTLAFLFIFALLGVYVCCVLCVRWGFWRPKFLRDLVDRSDLSPSAYFILYSTIFLSTLCSSLLIHNHHTSPFCLPPCSHSLYSPALLPFPIPLGFAPLQENRYTRAHSSFPNLPHILAVSPSLRLQLSPVRRGQENATSESPMR